MIIDSHCHLDYEPMFSNLDNVIKYEKIAKSTDSILYILSLTREKQIEFFRNLILEKQAKELTMINWGKKRFKLFSKNQPSEQFYFYNPSLLIQGEQKFLSIWGERSNVDNWRVSSIPKYFDSTISFNDGPQEPYKKSKIETPNNGIAIIAAGTIPIKVLMIAVKVNAAIISLILIGAINRLVKFLLQISSKNIIL